MRRKNLLDDIDRKLVALLYEFPEMTQVEISKALGLSQSSVAARLSRLKREELIRNSFGLNVRKLRLSLCRIDASAHDLARLVGFAKRCPLFVNALITTSERNTSLFFVVESEETLGHITNEHIRRLEGVTNLEVSAVYDSAQPLFLRINTGVNKVQNPPCGIPPFCPGCPASPSYKGRFWPSRK